MTSPQVHADHWFQLPSNNRFLTPHGLSHLGARPSIKLITARYVWPGICRDVRDWCRGCHHCQAAKVARHTKTPVTTLPPVKRRFGNVHIDLVGPLPVSEVYRYFHRPVHSVACRCTSEGHHHADSLPGLSTFLVADERGSG